LRDDWEGGETNDKDKREQIMPACSMKGYIFIQSEYSGCREQKSSRANLTKPDTPIFKI
jgi:hypothetical protein